MNRVTRGRRSAHPRGVIVQAERVDHAKPRPKSPEFTYSILPEASVEKADRRGDSRQRTRLRSGKLIGPDGRFLSECVIQNRSLSGGRIRLPTPMAPPPRLFFYDDQTEQLFDAAVQWHKDRDLGIILTPCTMNAANRAIAGRMRRKFYTLRG